MESSMAGGPIVENAAGQPIEAQPTYQVASDGAGGGTAVEYADAGGYPAGASPLQASSGNKANAVASALLAATPGQLTYITGATVTGGGTTAGGAADLTISGLLGGTMTIPLMIPAGANVPLPPLNLTFIPPLPASAVNTAITASLPALGAGGLSAGVTVRGFSK